MARETDGLAMDFRQLVDEAYAQPGFCLSRDPQRAANFVVLRQAETPAVLIELGYISHAEEEKQMRSAEWQRHVAAAITAAIEDYFTKRRPIFR